MNDLNSAPSDRVADPKIDARRLRRAFAFAASFAAVLWLIKLIDLVLGLDLVRYGVYPRQADGLPGILWAPLIHGSLSHVFANTAPVVILGTALLYGYPKSSRFVIPLIYLGSGLGVWLFARSAFHIGASGLTFGMMFFVFTIGVLRWDKRAIVLSLIVFFLYGGMIWGVFPSDPGISFEAHFFGAVSGLVLAVLFKNFDPAPAEKKYSWELEPDEEAVPGRAPNWDYTDGMGGMYSGHSGGEPDVNGGPVSHWDADSEGELNEQAMRRKLERRGYRVTRYVYPPGSFFPEHTHAVDKIDAVLSGRFRLVLEGVAVVLEAGDAVEVPRGARHSAAGGGGPGDGVDGRRGARHSAEVLGDSPVVSLDAVRE